MASTFGTLLSSQRTDAHPEQPFRALQEATSRISELGVRSKSIGSGELGSRAGTHKGVDSASGISPRGPSGSAVRSSRRGDAQHYGGWSRDASRRAVPRVTPGFGLSVHVDRRTVGATAGTH